MGKSKTIKALSLGEGISLLVSFLLLPYLSRSLPIEVYGTYGQVLFYVDIFKAFALIGLNKVLFLYINDSNEEYTELTNNIYAALIMGFGAFFVCSLTAPLVVQVFKNEKLLWPIIIYAFSIPFQIAFTCYSSILVYKSKSTILGVVSVISNLLRYLFIIIILLYTEDIKIIFAATTLAFFIQFLIIYNFTKVKLSIQAFNWDIIKRHIIAGFPLGLTSILGVLYYMVDSVVVSAILTPEEYAILRNGAFQIPFLSSIYGIVGLTLMPEIGKLLAQKKFKDVLILKKRVTEISAFIIIPAVIFLISFSYIIIPLLFSDLYKGSVVVFMIYNIMTLFRLTDYEGVIVLSNKGNYLPKVYLVSFVLNIILSIPFTYYFGTIGAASASIISFLYLIVQLTNYNLELLHGQLKEFVSLEKIRTIFVYSFITIGIVYMLIYLFQQSTFINLIFIGFGVSFLYHFLLKTDIISNSDKLLLFKQISNRKFQLLLIKFYKNT